MTVQLLVMVTLEIRIAILIVVVDALSIRGIKRVLISRPQILDIVILDVVVILVLLHIAIIILTTINI